MTDNRFGRTEDPSQSARLGSAIDGAVGKITTGIVIAGAIVGLAVYARPGPPRFDAFAFGDSIVRVDGKTGTIIACRGEQTCRLILRKGQRLIPVKRSDALPSPARPLSLPPAAPAAGK